MKPLHIPCSYCKNNKKRSNCSSLCANRLSESSRTKIKSSGNTNKDNNLHRFSIERLIKRSSLFGIVALEDIQNKSFISNCRETLYFSVVNGINEDNGIDARDRERKRTHFRKATQSVI